MSVNACFTCCYQSLPFWFLQSIILLITLFINPSWRSIWPINWALFYFQLPHVASSFFCTTKSKVSITLPSKVSSAFFYLKCQTYFLIFFANRSLSLPYRAALQIVSLRKVIFRLTVGESARFVNLLYVNSHSCVPHSCSHLNNVAAFLYITGQLK